MKIFSERLKEEREYNKITQKEFAEKLAIFSSTDCHYEQINDKDGRAPPFEMVIRMCEILGVTLNYLFGLED